MPRGFATGIKRTDVLECFGSHDVYPILIDNLSVYARMLIEDVNGDDVMYTNKRPWVVEFEWQKTWPNAAKFSGNVRGVYFQTEEVVVWEHPKTKKFHADRLTYADAKYLVSVGVVGEVRRGLHPMAPMSLCVAGVNALNGRTTFEKICREYLLAVLHAPE